MLGWWNNSRVKAALFHSALTSRLLWRWRLLERDSLPPRFSELSYSAGDVWRRMVAAEDLLFWEEAALRPQVHVLGQPDRLETGDGP